MKAHLKAIVACILIIGLMYCLIIYPIITTKIIVGVFTAIMFYSAVYVCVNNTEEHNK